MGLDMKSAVYGIGGSAEKFYNILKERNEAIEIVYFVQTEKTESVFHGKRVITAIEIEPSDFDKLVIASDNYYEEINEYLKSLDNGYELYKKAVRYDLLFSGEWENSKKIMPYQSCKIQNGITYIAASEDEYMLGYMYRTGRNYSENLINAFFCLTEKYYGQEKPARGGIFLDIGANLGTTSIYVKKNIDRELHVIGFEPSISNYDLFRVNCILNHVEDIKAEWLGLSSNNGKRKFLYSIQQSGMSRIVDDSMFGDNIDTIEVKKLDDYLAENKISPYSINYIWIDAEGHEDEIIKGAMGTLQAKKIPLLQECNPGDYLEKNTLNDYCKNLVSIYDYFIDLKTFSAEEEKPIPISQIYDYVFKIMDMKNEHTDLFFF